MAPRHLPFHRPLPATELTEPLAVFGAAESSNQRHRQRQLDGDGSSYFVDSNGGSYQAYSLSWRYLGLFIDCSSNGGGGGGGRGRRRRLEDNNNSCQRKLLWAAYHDADYSGGSIGEYSFYDRSLGGHWDSRTCRQRWMGPFAPRCQKLDCHQSGTSFELVGVFKETYGLYDWSEQLFKHQGYCQWNGDKQNEGGSGSGDSRDGDRNGQYSNDYVFMSSMVEKWVQGCTELEDHTDPDTGSALYVDTKPMKGGDMTYGVYTDASCSTESASVTWSDVLAGLNNGNGEDQSGDHSNDNDNDGNYMSAGSIKRWNELLGDYKICQPCRAYNRVKNKEGSSRSGSGSGDGGSNSNDENNEDEEEEWGEDDGEGSNEQWGYDCEDAAGYLNCNQCYKFETQTDMERASTADLQLATEQGTILSVKVNGVTYGSGYYRAPGHAAHVVVNSLLVTAALVGLGYFLFKEYRKHRRAGTASQKEGLTDDEHDEGGGSAAAERGSWYDWLYDKQPSWMKTDPHETSAAADSYPYNSSMADSYSTADSYTAADSYTTADSYRKDELLAQIQERDAKLNLREQRIQQLQAQLDSYKSIPVVEGVTRPGGGQGTTEGQSSLPPDREGRPSGEWT